MQTVPTIEPVLVGVRDGAHALGIGQTKFRELLNAGVIRSVYIDRRRLADVASIREYAAALLAQVA